MEDIAARLKRLRKEAGLTQAQLAAAAKISQGTIGNIESGVRGYGESLVDIAKALNVTPEYLRCEANVRLATRDDDDVLTATVVHVPSIGETIRHLAALLAPMSEIQRGMIRDAVSRVVVDPNLADEAAAMAEAVTSAAAARAPAGSALEKLLASSGAKPPLSKGAAPEGKGEAEGK